MKEHLVEYLMCVECKAIESFSVDGFTDETGEIKEGELRCGSCATRVPIYKYVPRFANSNNYARSFGFEWNMHARTQIDRFSGQSISRDRFFSVTHWPTEMQGERILEAGSGAGRFTQIAVETGAEVFSFDYSSAIDVNCANNGILPNLNLLQADIYRIPFKACMFDKVFCFGVLQHCPDVRQAFLSLVPHLKHGGEIVIDIYAWSLLKLLSPRYLLRPLTRRMEPERLYGIVERVVPILLPIKDSARRIPVVGHYVGGLFPIATYNGVYPLTEEQLLEWSILDTFDKLSARYDFPQSVHTVEKWFVEAGLIKVQVEYGRFGVHGRGVRP